MAANVSVPNTFTNGLVNDAPAVNADFTALVSWINTNAVHLDGAKAMTGLLAAPAGTDPSTADQYARKAYVDAGDARHGGKWSSTTTIVTGAITTISFGAEAADTDAYCAIPSTNVTIPAALGGIYAVTALVSCATGGSNDNVRILVDGLVVAHDNLSYSSGGFNYGTAHATVLLTVGQVLTCKVENYSSPDKAYDITFQVWRMSV